MSASSAPDRVYVGKRLHFTNGSRQLVRCGTRNIAVVCYRNELYAIDNACYHHGGPLLLGDIEEMGGHPCIICPWHSYKIALDTGEGLYLGVELSPAGGKPKHAVRSKGCKQRVHKVEVDEAEDVYVRVDLSGPTLESDAYASMELANRERPMSLPVDGGGRGLRAPGIHSHAGVELRSGQVFQHMGSLAKAGGNTGTRGANSLDNAQKTRPHEMASLGSSCSSPTTRPMVSCVAITDVCPQVRQFDFVHHAGPLLRHAELGEYVELELPIKERRPANGSDGQAADLLSSSAPAATAGELMRRRWTICDMNHNGSLFSIIVKAACTDTQASGSAWLHEHSLNAPLPIARVGGTFTFARHHDTIRRVGGRVLWLTAGIGVTPAYAFLNASLGDSLYVESAEPLHVVHLHSNRTLETVPKLEQFGRWQREFPRSALGTAEKTSGGSGARKPVKTYVMELFITPSTDAGQEQRTSAESSPPNSCPVTTITHRSRIRPANVSAAVQKYFGADMPLAYVCGPQKFVNDCTEALVSAGVPESHILTDDP
ncbi:Rieske [2Fe-2S] domain/Rieske-like [2Fe-2S] domain containing protein, putative [Leishmania donovani]|uniref:Rieske [2Fe-2S] domain/Rieske-like [2Fe-2S] domain containing protein, putative n=1 Tax=Leishmania donovani TaxID=5661 RepID=A0A3S7WZH8_LEIDO|nr:Rieske [2Fe-2S] domain/Rieske-like [2Fe-2S] domain containing protein, putative [Leishmania donovani]